MELRINTYKLNKGKNNFWRYKDKALILPAEKSPGDDSDGGCTEMSLYLILLNCIF